LSLFNLSAFTTINPYTNETQISKAAFDVAVGALTAAVTGLTSDDDSREPQKRTFIGTVPGALTGGLVVY
jgi:hypothetical protein